MSLGAQDVVVGDMCIRAVLEQAVEGVQSVYHICPNMSPYEFALGEMITQVARRAGVTHFVYHSVLHPQTEAMPHHWHKLRVEEHIFETGLPYTILQPAAYMQNVLAGWESIVKQGVYRVPYALETRLGMVDLEDVATVAAKVLTESGHQGAVYELSGAEALTQIEVAAELSRGLGRPVQVELLSLGEWERGARAAGLGDYQVETLIKMFHYYEQYGLWGNPNTLTWLLGCQPTTFSAFVERCAGSAL
jgi:NAD(P)H dehydrogenase (quinone)